METLAFNQNDNPLEPSLKLCRFEVEQVGANPEKVAREIHRQLLALEVGVGAVPIKAIAQALDIVEIRIEPDLGFEGMMLMPPNKARGSILVRRTYVSRMRFTVAHELFHFLSPSHKPVNEGVFACSKNAMRAYGEQVKTRYYRQEAEANRFAAELLIPRAQVRRDLGKDPEIEIILDWTSRFDVSVQAAAYHFTSQHDATMAVIVSKDGKMIYQIRSDTCPALNLRKGERLPVLPKPVASHRLSEWEGDFADDWAHVKGKDWAPDVNVQTYHQGSGYELTLVCFEEAGEFDDF